MMTTTRRVDPQIRKKAFKESLEVSIGKLIKSCRFESPLRLLLSEETLFFSCCMLACFIFFLITMLSFWVTHRKNTFDPRFPERDRKYQLALAGPHLNLSRFGRSRSGNRALPLSSFRTPSRDLAGDATTAVHKRALAKQ